MIRCTVESANQKEYTVSENSAGNPQPVSGPPPFEELSLSDERKAELAPKLRVLLTDLVKIRELEPAAGEPATPWPWHGGDDVR